MTNDQIDQLVEDKHLLENQLSELIEYIEEMNYYSDEDLEGCCEDSHLLLESTIALDEDIDVKELFTSLEA